MFLVDRFFIRSYQNFERTKHFPNCLFDRSLFYSIDPLAYQNRDQGETTFGQQGLGEQDRKG